MPVVSNWLERFISSPEKMRRNKDATALALMRKFPNVRMPDLGLTTNDVVDLISYLDERAAFLDRQAKEYADTIHGANAEKDQGKDQ